MHRHTSFAHSARMLPDSVERLAEQQLSRRRAELEAALTRLTGDDRIDAALALEELQSLSNRSLLRQNNELIHQIDLCRRFKGSCRPAIYTIVNAMMVHESACCMFSIQQLAVIVGRDKRQVSDAIADLIRAGKIGRVERPGRPALYYPIADRALCERFPPSWILQYFLAASDEGMVDVGIVEVPCKTHAVRHHGLDDAPMMSDTQTHDAARPYSKKEEEDDRGRTTNAVLNEARLTDYHRLWNRWSDADRALWLDRAQTDAQVAWDIKPHIIPTAPDVLAKCIDEALGRCNAELLRKIQAREPARGKFSSYFVKVLATAVTNQNKTKSVQAPLRMNRQRAGDSWLDTLAGRTLRDKLGSEEAAIQFMDNTGVDEGGSHVQ